MITSDEKLYFKKYEKEFLKNNKIYVTRSEKEYYHEEFCLDR